MTLTFDDRLISTVSRYIDHFENILVISGCNRWGTLQFTEVVHTKIMRYADGPWQELAFLIVIIPAKRVDYLDEYILEQVLSQVSVFYQDIDGGKNLVFVPVDQYL